MKRDLFVFAGQSNMMGAAVFPPRTELHINNSYEYKHKSHRLGNGELFVKASYPVGEFSYICLEKAYSKDMTDENGNSKLADYISNAFFCPAMSNLKSEKTKEVFSFSSFSESTAPAGATLAPLLAQEWEKLGNSCTYAHVTKGGVSINYYMTDEMCEDYACRIAEYNREKDTHYDVNISEGSRTVGAAEYFFEKCHDFFTDAEKHFENDDLSNKCFFWLQGESDACKSDVEYEMKLEILWERLKLAGFTHFFCIRVDYFGSNGIDKVMRAQENFVSRHSDAYMLTRAASYFTYPGQNEDKWFISPPDEEYRNCRDSFYGYNNQHINEKGFSVIASHASKNLYRVLIKNEEPLLETENIKALIGEENV